MSENAGSPSKAKTPDANLSDAQKLQQAIAALSTLPQICQNVANQVSVSAASNESKQANASDCDIEALLKQQLPKIVDTAMSACFEKFQGKLDQLTPLSDDIAKLQESQQNIIEQVNVLKSSIESVSNKLESSRFKSLDSLNQQLRHLDSIPSISEELHSITPTMVTQEDLREMEEKLLSKLEALFESYEPDAASTPIKPLPLDPGAREFTDVVTYDETGFSPGDELPAAPLMVPDGTSDCNNISSDSVSYSNDVEHFAAPENVGTSSRSSVKKPLSPTREAPVEPVENSVQPVKPASGKIVGFDSPSSQENVENLDFDSSGPSGKEMSDDETASCTDSERDPTVTETSAGPKESSADMILQNRQLLEALTVELEDIKCLIQESSSNISNLETELMVKADFSVPMGSRPTGDDSVTKQDLKSVSSAVEDLQSRVDTYDQRQQKYAHKILTKFDEVTQNVVDEIKVWSEDNDTHKEVLDAIEKQTEEIETVAESLKEYSDTSTTEHDHVVSVVENVSSEMETALNEIVAQKVYDINDQIQRSENYVRQTQQSQLTLLQDLVKDQNEKCLSKLSSICTDLKEAASTNVKEAVENMDEIVSSFINVEIESLTSEVLKPSFERVEAGFQDIRASFDSRRKIDKLAMDRMNIFNQFGASINKKMVAVGESIDRLNKLVLALKIDVRSDELAFEQLKEAIEKNTDELPDMIKKQSDSVKNIQSSISEVANLCEKSSGSIENFVSTNKADLETLLKKLSECTRLPLPETENVTSLMNSLKQMMDLKLDQLLVALNEQSRRNEDALASSSGDAGQVNISEESEIPLLELNEDSVVCVGSVRNDAGASDKIEGMLFEIMAQLKVLNNSVNSVGNISNLINGGDSDEYVSKEDLSLFHQSLVENLMQVANGNDCMIGGVLVHNQIRSLIDQNTMSNSDIASEKKKSINATKNHVATGIGSSKFLHVYRRCVLVFVVIAVLVSMMMTSDDISE